MDNTPEQKYEVTPLELFFDLVFVFAVSQLSHHLLAHLSWRGTAETLVMLVAVFAVLREHFFWILIWFIASSPLWIAGAAANPDTRLLWWTLAVGINLTGMLFGHPVPGRRLQSENVGFAGSHMLERCRLFLIIALGETVVTTGTAITIAPTSLMTVVTGTVALIGTVAIWALAFGRAHHLIVQQVEETRDPYRASRHAVSALIALVAGLIAVQGWYLWFVPQVWPRLRMIGSAVLVMVGFAALICKSNPYVLLVPKPSSRRLFTAHRALFNIEPVPAAWARFITSQRLFVESKYCALT